MSLLAKVNCGTIQRGIFSDEPQPPGLPSFAPYRESVTVMGCACPLTCHNAPRARVRLCSLAKTRWADPKAADPVEPPSDESQWAARLVCAVALLTLLFERAYLILDRRFLSRHEPAILILTPLISGCSLLRP